jgi:hypothetical protein
LRRFVLEDWWWFHFPRFLVWSSFSF